MNAIWGLGYIGSGIFDPERHISIGHYHILSRPGASLEGISGVIWCAGWPGEKNVDDVEKNPVRSELQNVWEPLEVAQRCKEAGIRMLVLCSGCIFDGLNDEGEPHKETDAPNFTSTVYLSHQARRAATLMRDYSKIATIFRIRVPFDGRKHPRNTLHKLSKMPEVWDKEQSYTWLPDLARAIKLWEDGTINGGIWHVTQPGTMNNYDAVREELNPEVKRISGGDRPEKAMACPRSAAILDSSKLQGVMTMTPVREAWENSCLQYGTVSV